MTALPAPAVWARSSSTSASTSIFTRSSKRTSGSHPSCSRILVGSPTRAGESLAPRAKRLVVANVVAPVEADVLEGCGDELLDSVRLAGRDDVVVRLVGLEHQPHRPHVVAGEAPVPLGGEVAEPQLLLEPEADRRRAAADLPGQELLRAPRRLVVEEDRRGRVQPVMAAERAGQEVGERLAGAVRRDRRDRRLLDLRHLRRRAEDLGRSGVQKPSLGVLTAEPFEERGRGGGGEGGGADRVLPGGGDERRRGEVVDLVGLELPNRRSDGISVGQLELDELDPVLRSPRRNRARCRRRS